MVRCLTIKSANIFTMNGFAGAVTVNGGLGADMVVATSAINLTLTDTLLVGVGSGVTLVSIALADLVSPWVLLLTAFVGVSQWLFVATGACPASLVIERVFHVERGCAR